LPAGRGTVGPSPAACAGARAWLRPPTWVLRCG